MTTQDNIGEANITPARGLTLTGQRVWGGGQPPPQHTQLCVQPSLAFERPLRLTLLGAFARPRRPRDHAGLEDVGLRSSREK